MTCEQSHNYNFDSNPVVQGFPERYLLMCLHQQQALSAKFGTKKVRCAALHIRHQVIPANIFTYE